MMANNIMSENSLRTCIIAACAIGYAIISFFIPELNILIAIAHLLFTLIGMVGVEIIGGKSTTGIIIVLLSQFQKYWLLPVNNSFICISNLF